MATDYAQRLRVVGVPAEEAATKIHAKVRIDADSGAARVQNDAAAKSDVTAPTSRSFTSD